MARVLALDHGSARCGCAVSDPSGTLATPLAAVERPDSKKGLAAVARLVAMVNMPSRGSPTFLGSCPLPPMAMMVL